MAANWGHHFEIIKAEIYETQFISQKNVYTYTSDNCNLCLLYRYSFYADVLGIVFFNKV